MERREYLARLDRALRELTGSRERQDILAYYQGSWRYSHCSRRI